MSKVARKSISMVPRLLQKVLEAKPDEVSFSGLIAYVLTQWLAGEVPGPYQPVKNEIQKEAE